MSLAGLPASVIHSPSNGSGHRAPLAVTICGMPNSLPELAFERGGYFTTADAHDFGHDGRAIRDAVRAGEWRHLRRGAYSLANTYDLLEDAGRHLVRARAVVAKLGRDRVAVSHQSASCAYEHQQWGWDMSVVNVTRLDRGAPREEAGIKHHVGRVVESDLVDRGGLLVMREDRAVVEACTQMPVEAGLCIVDSALRRERINSEMLLAYGDLFCDWPGSRRARLAVWLGDGGAASVGESRSRHLFWRFGVPAPDLQYEVRNDAGTLLGTADFGWELYRHVGEFDGRRKYTRDLKPGEDAGQVVFREKRREDAMRGENLGMSRLVWAELEPPVNRFTARRFYTDMLRSRRLYTRNRVIIA